MIINACNRHGYDGAGEGGLEGLYAAHRGDGAQAMLLARVMPTQLEPRDVRVDR